MTEEEKKDWYESYLNEYYYDRGTEKGAVSYEEFCTREMWKEFIF